jgi:hypothetical protein
LNIGNTIESVRVAITSDDNIEIGGCNVHQDNKNDPSNPRVVIFSKLIIFEGKRLRISFIQYTRKSVADFYVRKGAYAPAFEWIFNCYEEMRRANQPVNQLCNIVPQDHKGISCSKLTPNVNPAVHHALMADCVLRLHSRFDLTLVEMHSVLLAFAYIPGAPFFVVQAAEKASKVVRGPLLGYNLCVFACELWAKEGKGSDRIQRYSMYNRVQPPTKTTFRDNTYKSARLSLVLFRDHPEKPNPEKPNISTLKSREHYNSTQKRNTLGVLNFGLLGSNHILGAMAILGLVPFWMYGECQLDPTSKGFQYICDRFGVRKGAVSSRAFFQTLCHAFRNRYGISSPRFCENLICKCFQRYGTKVWDKNEAAICNNQRSFRDFWRLR